MEEKKVSLTKLFFTFFRVGLITFGGGYAMLPILERDVVAAKGWITKEELLDYYAVCRSLPGLIAVNVSTFIGNKKAKGMGGVVAALGVITPSIIIITIIAALLSGFRDNVYVQHAISGISICVLALIISSIISLWKKGITDWIQLLICIATFCLSTILGLSPVICIVIALVAGVAASFIKERGKK